ncbi:aldehyde reductase [Phanerochaete sordida]|uniref:Aldehyde reductase n=1 Tax=Phanerochaete sordida TaxID=48140 RepID=A0A9P3G309_9APHY|nr:aldehyde reductase [Phanerochaete sordida]
MPAVAQGKVLVTGANGYIAVWVVKTLLDQGYSVRGTVRRESAIPHLKETFKEYADKLELIVVPDITKDGAFDEAVKGVDAIEHTASPFHMNAKEPDELIIPAVRGTRSVLQSALQFGDRVRRVVITSSTASVLTDDGLPHVFTEADWNDRAVQDIAAQGAAAPPHTIYRASKTLAERAAWQFVEENKEKVQFDVVALNPPYVWGPFLHEVDKPENLNTSVLDWYNTIVKNTRTPEQLVSITSSWVDVRDIALAHALSLQKPEAGGERIIISGGYWTWQDWINAARKYEPSLPAGNTSYDPKSVVYKTRYDASKSERILGITYHSMDESAADIVKQLKEKGWLQ